MYIPTTAPRGYSNPYQADAPIRWVTRPHSAMERPTTRPAHASTVGEAAADDQPSTRAHHVLRQGEVLGHFVTHRTVPVERAVGIGGEHHELSVGDGVAPLAPPDRSLDVVEAQDHREEDLGLHQPLPEGGHDLAPAHREEVRTAPVEFGQGAPEQVRLVHGVGVGEEQNLAAGSFGSLPARPRLAQPSPGQFRACQHLDPLRVSWDTEEASAAVSSSLRSSTTMISKDGWRAAAIERMQRSMLGASLRAGTI